VLLRLILDKDTNQIVHALVLIFLSILIDIELFAEKTVPVLFKLGFCGLADHLSLDLNGILFICSEERFDSASR
jgi:hypothetical protein